MRRSTLIATFLTVLLVAGVAVAMRAQSSPVAAQSSIIAVSAVDFAFSPSTITAMPGQTIRLTNNGNAPHNVVIEGVTDSMQMPLVFAGASGDLVVPANLSPGPYVFYCGVAGHRQFGMVGTLTIVAANASASAAPSSPPSASASGSSSPSVSARPSVSAQPSGSARPSASASGTPSSRPSASARSTRPPRPTSTVRPPMTTTPDPTATVRPPASTRPPRPTATFVQPTATPTPPASARPTRPPRQ